MQADQVLRCLHIDSGTYSDDASLIMIVLLLRINVIDVISNGTLEVINIIVAQQAAVFSYSDSRIWEAWGTRNIVLLGYF